MDDLQSQTVNGLDLREVTFQNVIDNVLRPSGINIGGFPEDLFLSLSEEEQQDMMCNICRSSSTVNHAQRLRTFPRFSPISQQTSPRVVNANDCRLCDNNHVFCRACIVGWTLTFGENAQKCPVCRCDQSEYSMGEELQKRICSKKVRCCEEGCAFRSTLAEFLLHEHGKVAYSNEHVDFESLTRPQLSRPMSATENDSHIGISSNIRSQLLQSRTMIQQMMMLMRIEMQLRQQALFNFQQSQESEAERPLRLDHALALNNQLSEISSVLGTLIRSTAGTGRSSRRWPTHRDGAGSQRLRRADGSVFTRLPAVRRVSGLSARQWRDTDSSPVDDSSATDDNDDDDDEILHVNGPVRVNEMVDNFVWPQFNDSDTEDVGADNARSPPDGISIASAASSFHVLPNIESIADDDSVSRISSVGVPLSTMSPSMLYDESRQMTPRYLLCTNCQERINDGQCGQSSVESPACVSCLSDNACSECPCELCTGLDGLAVGDVEDEEHEGEYVHEVGVESNQSGVQDHVPRLETSRSRSMLNERACSECAGAAACDPLQASAPTLPAVTDSLTNNVSSVEVAHAASPFHQPVMPAGYGFPASQFTDAGRDYAHQSLINSPSLAALPAARRPAAFPPFLNYAARLRMQAAERARLPSDYSIRPWPLPDSTHCSAVTNNTTSLGMTGVAIHRPAPSLGIRTNLSTYHLPSRQSSSAVQRGGMQRSRGIRTSRYSSSTRGDHPRMPRP